VADISLGLAAETDTREVMDSEAILGLNGVCRSNTKPLERHDVVVTPVIYRAITEQLSGDLGGEAVILSLKTGKYYGLNLLGARIWELLQTPRSTAAIEETILAEFDVEPDECSSEVRAFVDLLKAEGLIESVNGVAEIPPTSADGKDTDS
jgi:hypothetical protein